MRLVNYLSENNKLYNYKFRNTTCLPLGTCEFPEPNPVYENTCAYRMFMKILKLSTKLLIYYSIVFWLVWSVVKVLKIGVEVIKKMVLRDD